MQQINNLDPQIIMVHVQNSFTYFGRVNALATKGDCYATELQAATLAFEDEPTPANGVRLQSAYAMYNEARMSAADVHAMAIRDPYIWHRITTMYRCGDETAKQLYNAINSYAIHPGQTQVAKLELLWAEFYDDEEARKVRS